MKYLLDTDSLSFLYGNPEDPLTKSILEKVTELSEEDVLTVSVLNFYELEYSYFLASDEKKPIIRHIIDQISQGFVVFPLRQNSSSLYAELKGKLKQTRNIPPKNMRRYNIDLMLASTAITENAILVSLDQIYPTLVEINQQFQHENWTV